MTTEPRPTYHFQQRGERGRERGGETDRQRGGRKRERESQSEREIERVKEMRERHTQREVYTNTKSDRHE